VASAVSSQHGHRHELPSCLHMWIASVDLEDL